MSTASAAPTADDAPPARPSRKKLIIMIGAAVLALCLAAGGAVIVLKKRAAAQAAAEEAEAVGVASAQDKPARRDPKSPPTFVPLDPFTVNLADREAERYAQIGISLELSASDEADRIKVFMPVIRNNILMVIAHKTSADLLERDGKTRLAREIRRETARALGIDVPTEEEGGAKGAARGKADDPELPVSAVHFSNFIIQ